MSGEHRKPVADDTLWPIYSRNEPRYFILNGELRGIGHGPRATACAFWNEFMPLITARQSKRIDLLLIIFKAKPRYHSNDNNETMSIESGRYESV